MSPRIDQPVHLFRGMMHGVEAPEPWDLMRPAMTPVGSDVADNRGEDDTNRQGQRRTPLIERSGKKMIGSLQRSRLDWPHGVYALLGSSMRNPRGPV
jgi:hypothetical protein